MTNQTIINGITYNIMAEVSILNAENIQAHCKGYYVSNLLLKRPRGHKEFWAMRDKFGNVTIL